MALTNEYDGEDCRAIYIVTCFPPAPSRMSIRGWNKHKIPGVVHNEAHHKCHSFDDPDVKYRSKFKIRL